MSTPDFERLNYYDLLGVARNASTDEIKRAFRREMSRYHPDRFVQGTPDEQAYAVRRSQRLTEAYAILNDFSARLNYNRALAAEASPTSPRDSRPPSERPAATAPPPVQRDLQAELYLRARTAMQAGRNAEALKILRQLERQNPFYRDIAELIARLESVPPARSTPMPAPARIPSLWIGVGILGGAGLIILLAWALAPREPDMTISAADLPTPTLAQVATLTPTRTPTPLPTATPRPTRTATPLPTSTRLPTCTAEPTVAPTVAPLVIEQGLVLLSDAFDGSEWADAGGEGWSVGYTQGRYRISVAPGYGSIWSYRTAPDGDISVGADVQTNGGAAGLLLRFDGPANYVSFEIDPRTQSYRLTQYANTQATDLLSGQSNAITAGSEAVNRLVAELRGQRVVLYINGQLVDSVTATGSSASGRFGLIATADATAVEALFDNVAVRGVE